MPPAGVQGAEPLGGGQGAKPQHFWHFKGVPDMYFCGYYDKIPKTIVLCFKLNVSIKAVICTLAFMSVFIYYIVSNHRDKNMQTLNALIKDLGNTDLCVFPK